MKSVITVVLFTSVALAGMTGIRNSLPEIRSEHGLQQPGDTLNPFQKANEKCFLCHGQKVYEYSNENLGKTIKASMCAERVIDRTLFYQSNHHSFMCTDCHSDQYSIFPHPGELRMEQKFNCIDCHGGDPAYEEFRFEMIEEEYGKSTHYRLEESGFSCWSCHDPHTYKTVTRKGSDISQTVLFSNGICLDCHGNNDRYAILSDGREINIVKEHDWLPHQAAHMRSVRCLECHAEKNDTLLVSHFVKPAENAVKGCNECHSKNSMLMASLYRYQAAEDRKSMGFLNSVILNQSYVIGATRNEFLNILSLVIFGAVLLVIAIHIFFRIKKSATKHKGGENVPLS